MSMKKTAVVIFIAVIVLAAAGGYFFLSGDKGKKGKDAVKTEKSGEKASNNVYDVAKLNAYDPGPLPEARNLFIMGWDGAGRERVLPLLKEGKLPNLKKFLDDGATFAPMNISGPTHTVPVWTEVFTGLTYDQTGASGNHKFGKANFDDDAEFIKTKYNPEGNVYPGIKFWIEEVPYEHTILYPIQKGGYKIGWFVSKMNIGKGGALEQISRYADASETTLTGPEDEYDQKKEVNEKYIEVLYEKTKDFASKNERYMIFFHVNPDAYGHAFNADSQRYKDEIIRVDRFFGEMLKSIDRKTTKIVVIADHGFNDPLGSESHSNAPWAWLATDLPIDPIYAKIPVLPRDAAYTIQDYYGIDPAKRKPVQRGHSLLKEDAK